MQITDLTLVCGSRPELLEQMLQSFDKFIFGQIEVGKVFVNIDLYGGNEEKRKSCSSMILRRFPHAVIQMPPRDSFGSAVKTLWSKPSSQNFLHLEDDWIALKPIRIDRILKTSNSRIKQWSLVKPRVEQSLFTSFRYRPLEKLPFFFPNVRRPAFTTSPSLIDSQFAHGISKLLDPLLNPEKQMFNGMNVPLENYLRDFRCLALHKWWEKESIVDIGRAWQSSRGIRVEIVDGVHTYKRVEEEI
jgi:hypothetical protein